MFQHKNKYGFILFLTIYSFLNILVLNGDRLYKAKLPAVYLLIVLTCLCFAIWFINLAIDKHLLKKFVRIHPLIIQFVFSIIGILLLSFLSVSITSSLIGFPFKFEFKNLVLTAAFLFRVNLFLNTINAVFYYNKKFKQKEVESEKMRLATLSARYEVLNNQINPHFLFNNLNTLSSLLHSDIGKADQFLQKLAETYRYVLKNKGNELVSLKEELDFIEEYSALLMIRFKNALKIDIEVDESLKKYELPPTVLQLLIENVVKHNFFTDSKPVHILIKSEGKSLIVSNNLQLKEVTEYSSGIGLKNISERYKFFNKHIIVNKSHESFNVEIPLIQLSKDENNYS